MPVEKQRVAETALRVEGVLWVQIKRGAVGCGCLFWPLELIVAGTESELDAGGLILRRDCGENLGGAAEVALLRVEAGDVEHNLFRVRIDLLSALELRFSLGGVVVEAVQLAEQKMRLDVVGLELD